jgi:hypothetical protein
MGVVEASGIEEGEAPFQQFRHDHKSI